MIQVHARCYGELKQLDGGLWLCNLCRPGAPRVSPKCCLCPVTGTDFHPMSMHNEVLLMGCKTFFRWCNETYNRWPLGSSRMRYMDPW